MKIVEYVKKFLKWVKMFSLKQEKEKLKSPVSVKDVSTNSLKKRKSKIRRMKNNNRKTYLRRRRQFLKAYKKTHGVFKCYICGNSPLIDGLDDSKFLSDDRKLTIDHFIPLKDGGRYLDSRNFRVCCKRCNSRR